MIHYLVDIPLCKSIKGTSFWKDVAYVFVALFDAGLLPCTHMVSVINTGTYDVEDVCLKDLWKQGHCEGERYDVF